MPWNEPGSGKSPNNNRGQGPDLQDIINNLKGGFGGGKKSSGSGPSIFPIIILALIAYVLWNSFYTVKEGFESVELRLGRYTQTEGAGLNHLWWPIEKKFLVNTQTLRTVEVGIRDRIAKPAEALMLTNDENIVDVTMAVQYTIKNVEDLIFNVGNVEQAGVLDNVVRGATESALREVVGSTKMDDLLTQGRNIVDANTKELLQLILDRYKTGIQVDSIEIQDAKPPSQVSNAFDDVVKADQDKVTSVNRAEAYANDIIPKARGRAARILQEAEAYKATTIAKATGEADRFDQILKEYQKAPEVTRKRLYLETMENVLSKTSKVMVDSSSGNSLMYLPIDKIIENNAKRSNNSTSNVDVPINESLDIPVKNTTKNNIRSAIREGRK